MMRFGSNVGLISENDEANLPVLRACKFDCTLPVHTNFGGHKCSSS